MCFSRFRRRWDPKGSVINVFATFLLLSYSKLLTVSYSLLDASTLYNNRGTKVGPFVVFFDASIEYFMQQTTPSNCFTFNMCAAGVCCLPTVTSSPVPHEIILEVSQLLY